MKAEAFHLWMRPQYTESSAANRVSRVRRIETAYGDIDELYDRDRLDSLLTELNYSTTDERAKKPNPTKMSIGGDLYRQLASLKNALARYREFRDSGGDLGSVSEAAIEVASQAIREKREGKQFEVERHLQESSRREIGQLEEGLIVIDDGDERAVASGFIDILAEDRRGALTVVEPDRAVRGILVAAEFDKSCLSSIAVVPDLSLREYRFDFAFDSPRAA